MANPVQIDSSHDRVEKDRVRELTRRTPCP